jgi:hypothetical protein
VCQGYEAQEIADLRSGCVQVGGIVSTHVRIGHVVMIMAMHLH